MNVVSGKDRSAGSSSMLTSRRPAAHASRAAPGGTSSEPQTRQTSRSSRPPEETSSPPGAARPAGVTPANESKSAALARARGASALKKGRAHACAPSEPADAPPSTSSSKFRNSGCARIQRSTARALAAPAWRAGRRGYAGARHACVTSAANASPEQ